MFRILLICISSLILSCTGGNKELALIHELEKLQIKNDSLIKVIDELKALNSQTNLILDIDPYSTRIVKGDSMKFFIGMNIIKEGDEKYPILYYSGDKDAMKDVRKKDLVKNLYSIEIKNWHANISIPQYELGPKTIYFNVRVPYNNDVVEYVAEFNYNVLPNSPTIQKFK